MISLYLQRVSRDQGELGRACLYPNLEWLAAYRLKSPSEPVVGVVGQDSYKDRGHSNTSGEKQRIT